MDGGKHSLLVRRDPSKHIILPLQDDFLLNTNKAGRKLHGIMFLQIIHSSRIGGTLIIYNNGMRPISLYAKNLYKYYCTAIITSIMYTIIARITCNGRAPRVAAEPRPGNYIAHEAV